MLEVALTAPLINLFISLINFTLLPSTRTQHTLDGLFMMVAMVSFDIQSGSCLCAQ